MNDTEVAFTLPDRETMLTKLKLANPHESLLAEFFPELLRMAGEEKYPSGLVINIMHAMVMHADRTSEIIGRALQMQMSRWIDAMTPDEASATATKAYYAEVMAKKSD